MEKTRLSSKGQVILPKSVRDAHRWPPGTEFIVEDTAEGVLLRLAKPLPPTRLEDVVGCLRYAGKPKTLGHMEAAIRSEVITSTWSRSILTCWFGC
jgi:AbrB family looped-hinge helix DNA binding protein